MRRIIQSNGLAIWFRTTKACEGWYPSRCDVHALVRCRKAGVLKGVCWDLGAHHGLYSIIMGATPEVSEVYAFEPIGHHYRLATYNITQNAALLKGKKIHIFPHPVGDGSEVSFDGDMPVQPNGSDKIKTVRLSDLNVEPDFIKMDVEGFEKQVIDGMPSNLLRGRSSFYIELHPGIVDDYGFIWDHIDKSKYEIIQSGNELFGFLVG